MLTRVSIQTVILAIFKVVEFILIVSFIDSKDDLQNKSSVDNRFNNSLSNKSHKKESVVGTTSHVQPTNVTNKKADKSNDGELTYQNHIPFYSLNFKFEV